MFRKVLLLTIIIGLLNPIYKGEVQAGIQLSDYQDDELHLLLIYSNDRSAMTPSIKRLELLLKHFTNNVIVASDYEVTLDHFQSATHVFYYGEDKKEINKEVVNSLNDFSGPIISIGENIEQLKAFNYFRKVGEVNVNGVSEHSYNNDIHYVDFPIMINEMELTDGMSVMLSGHKGSHQYPLLIRESNRYYFATKNMEHVLKYYFAELLHDILPNNHVNEHVAYLRLEDIHPQTDPEKLLAVGEYLNERHIPYILVVIPVYIMPETGEKVHFSSSPELVRVLQYLQDTGGTVISHGYTHQYRDSETGEGFEFWDVENQQFIITNDPSEYIEKILSLEHFANKQDYETYIQDLKKRERRYMEQRLTDSIHELTYYDLYPLGFEASYYTVSDQGYEIVADFFTTILGQVQYSDKVWEVMGAPPYISSLGGMTLLPETIGYVDITLNQPFIENGRRLKEALIVRDSMIGGFYHSYLGVDYLPYFLEQYENVPNLRWFNLKQVKQKVSTEKVKIVTDGSGDIIVESNVSWWEHLLRQNSSSILEKILWGVTFLVFTFVLLFLFITIYLRTQLKKRLFRERRKIG